MNKEKRLNFNLLFMPHKSKSRSRSPRRSKSRSKSPRRRYKKYVKYGAGVAALGALAGLAYHQREKLKKIMKYGKQAGLSKSQIAKLSKSAVGHKSPVRSETDKMYKDLVARGLVKVK